ncbi:type I restriction-modification system endonuclease [Pseudenhygromyxa sp. WMMC2535]|uniref:type I restriction-modification system endonuclease n=1 Tax=Pseudenhygromyxa sp. WMMC2535 TaxID=2712867 RepID=UPI001551733E|nr:type I restriction-modification system endonuclease [Pseudenhygromyxa sp. WMMC2535]NVB39481.1 type I restriction-modification system endonuclease [Pseudenhygromyxa sp. WMMC2535]
MATVSADSINFAFLAKHSPLMVKTAAQAEHYFARDPTAALTKLRRLGELLAQHVGASNGLADKLVAHQARLIDALEDRGLIDAELARLFHGLRKAGNAAVHADEGSDQDALHQLEMAHALAVWFHRATAEPDFDPAPFTRPDAAAPDDGAPDEDPTERAAHEAQLARLQALAEGEDAQQLRLRLERARAAAGKLELNEAQTRELIDIQLREAGWEVDSKRLTHAAGTRPEKGRDLAISEWPTRSGPADYVLFRGLSPIAVVEAKRESKDVRGAIDQAKRYSRDFEFDDDMQPLGPWGEYEIPFLFSTNGRPYLRQYLQASGIWFLDVREPTNHRRALEGWRRPKGLAELLDQDLAAAATKLEAEALDYLPLRPYQREAIRAIEAGVAAGRRELLLAMATGTGKTRTLICLIYRLIKAGRFQRVLFLVDRTSLGVQAHQAFDNLELEQQKTFSNIYDVKELRDACPDDDTRLHIATVQAMVRRLDADAGAPAVDQYDCIVVDECHRGYNLDRELAESEAHYRSEREYISKYRRVLDHFDAVKIGLTATPALHTTEIFGEPVYRYRYRRAVIEGYLVDHEPPLRITTARSQSGVRWAAGEEVSVYRVREQRTDLIHTPDEIDIDIDGFNRRAIVPEFNKAVCSQLAREIDPSLPGKTLIFCANDRHADEVTGFMLDAFKEVYGAVEEDAVAKITGAVDRPGELIARYKNELNPRVAVTVDLLTTGIDVPQIVNLVFLRRVRSRILYDQMLGRATRLCPDIGKRHFRIFDAVDLYDALAGYTDMRPVVSDVQTRFATLLEGLAKLTEGDGGAGEHEDERRRLCEQLIAKLRRKRVALRGAAGEHFTTLTGLEPDALLAQMRAWSPDQTLDWWQARPALALWLDELRSGSGPVLPISFESDEVVDVRAGYGEHGRPEDYLDGFAAFVRDNLNTIPALSVVTQRPRDLTRAQLVELRMALAQAGYTEAVLEAAWRQSTNHEIAASIIGFIRQQALGEALVPYEQRVRAALDRLLAARSWSAPQRKWLERIAKQLEVQRVVDRAVIDEDEAFKAQGGFKRLDKIFGGELEQVLGELREAVWDDAG